MLARDTVDLPMRLGELLHQKGLITPEQLQTALHEQSRFGGRLGTNLIQLGYVEMDSVALRLSEQRSLPPVLREHVATVDKKTLALFPAAMVLAHKVIPIGYTMTKPGRVVVACMDPTTLPMEELAFAAGRRIEAWIAPEALIQECLERYFGVPRVQNRYVSVKLPARDAGAADKRRANPEGNAAAAPAPAKVSQPKPSAAAKLPPRALSPPPPPPSVTRTLEMPEMPAQIAQPSASEMTADPPEQPVPDLPPDSDWDIPEEPLEAPPEEPPVTAPPEALRPVLDRAEASRMLEMATSKDQIGRVLEDWLRSTFGCGLVLVVKSDMAIGWKGFFPDAEDLIEAVAIPLGKPTMFSAALESRAPFRGAPPADGARIHDRLWKLLRCAAPVEALVCPVMLGKRAVNLIYGHMEDGSAIPDGVVDDASALAGEAAAAYARLIGKERGKRP